MIPGGTTAVGRCSRRGAPPRTYIRRHNTTMVTQNYFYGIRRTCGHVHTGLAQKGPHKNVSSCHSLAAKLTCARQLLCTCCIIELPLYPKESFKTLPSDLSEFDCGNSAYLRECRRPESQSAAVASPRTYVWSMMTKAITLFGNELDGRSQGPLPRMTEAESAP